MPISITPPDACERNIRYINDDIYPRGQRIYFVQGNHSQSVMVQPRAATPFVLHTPDMREIVDIVDKLSDITGLDIPESFIKGTAIFVVPGILRSDGVHANSRVLRQQVFIGASPQPWTQEQIHRTLFNAIGNALWNYLEHRSWGSNQDQKNRYRELRQYKFDYDPSPGDDGNPRGRTRMVLQQQTLYAVASEDFRYLFGTSLAGRDEWFYNFGPDPIRPPNPEVRNFWISELEKSELTPVSEFARALE